MKGAPRSNYTQIPNTFLGEPFRNRKENTPPAPGQLAEMGHAETKIYLVVARATFGYHRLESRISFRTMAKITGLAPSNIRQAADDLAKKGLVRHRSDGGVTIWEMVDEGEWSQENDEDESVPATGTPVPATGTPSIKENKKEKNRAAAAAAVSSSGDWEGWTPQEVVVPAGGSKTRRAEYTEKCSECKTPLSQLLDRCPNPKCGQPIRWVGSPQADLRRKQEGRQNADRKAKELREGRAYLSETTKWLLDQARLTSPIGEAAYPQGMEAKILIYEQRYGEQEIKRVVQYLLSGDKPASGTGLLHATFHALGKKEQGGGRKGGKTPREQRGQVFNVRTAPAEASKPLDLTKPADLQMALAGFYGDAWQAKAEAFKAAKKEAQARVQENPNQAAE